MEKSNKSFEYSGPVLIQQPVMEDIIRRYFSIRHLVLPNGQDASTFCAQEAMEMVDIFLRRKTYRRNNPKNVDTLGKEAAQTLMMLVVTCMIEGIDLDKEFVDLMESAEPPHLPTEGQSADWLVQKP